MVLLNEFMSDNQDKRITTCAPSLGSPENIRIADMLQKSAELFYNPLTPQEELDARINFVIGFLMGVKINNKKEDVQTLLVESDRSLH